MEAGKVGSSEVSSSKVGGSKVGMEGVEVTSPPRTTRLGISYSKKRF
jgi:hypothetical protein